ncbi:MAG: type II secretion system F family protein [Eubacteriales bacterium]|nr:type II secretion system F family protein [Eubacteriales bacterium]
MAKYKYTARTEAGKTVRGVLDVPDEAALHQKLRSEELYPLSFKLAEGKKRTKRIKSKDLGEYSREMGTLLKSGVPLVRALGIISEEEAIPEKCKVIYKRVLQLIRQGTPLSDAMEEQGDAFPPLMIEMFRSSEMSGTMDKTALRMATHYEKEYRLNSKVKSAMVYPMILGILIVVVVIFLLTYVLPQFESLFSQMESLPLPTRMLYAIGDFITEHWLFLLILLMCLITAWVVLSKVPAIRYQLDRIKLRLPIVGKLIRVIYTARFASSLSSLYSAGIPIVSALQICRKIVGNYYMDEQFDAAIAHVRSGGRLSEALREVDGFINKLSSSIMIGEETGSLDTMLDAAADSLEYESEIAIGKLVAMLEPVMIIVMALIVGFVLISVIMPLYGSYNSIESSAY